MTAQAESNISVRSDYCLMSGYHRAGRSRRTWFPSSMVFADPCSATASL